MGFQVRKRTKGKDAWTNASYSSRGLHVSNSVKAGRATFNSSSRGLRTTFNFGNGVRYVSNIIWPWNKKKQPDVSVNKEPIHNIAEEVKPIEQNYDHVESLTFKRFAKGVVKIVFVLLAIAIISGIIQGILS